MRILGNVSFRKEFDLKGCWILVRRFRSPGNHARERMLQTADIHLIVIKHDKLTQEKET